jgi:hypothetical protein
VLRGEEKRRNVWLHRVKRRGGVAATALGEDEDGSQRAGACGRDGEEGLGGGIGLVRQRAEWGAGH